MKQLAIAAAALLLVTQGLANAQGTDAGANDTKTVDAKALNDIKPAISECMVFMRNKKVDDSGYWKYVDSKKKAAEVDRKVLTFDSKVGGAIPKDVFPVCDKMIADYEKGIGYESDPVSKACENNVMSRLDPILNGTYEKQAKEKGKSFVVWFPRKDLEAARWYMTGKDGFKTLGRICEVPDKFRKAFAPLAAKMKDAETAVAAWEAAKGVTFIGVKDNNSVRYKDAKTGAEIADSSNY